ncbi:ribosome maturation factor RimP [Limosilactobacillus fastidiosus]|uniref:Ribosome maturation factor RimP n=1 Tax=Limosilactobacillus fastidiosus TaxID=2759855 RepID=A0A7W3U0G8_9LACO|nr:ribosome maturation factor RimP [Limosilactobacillus fastidiosus]MBB1062271.1 ribosome maturation factor RimP [Limosilactobacillus fastidiosus]MBB1086661.1 ribosome maturation factor RimP [Limosilactobacillus fastidiosus]MCD7083348.1 ribosome maturation factor RimP [Limosilactobacillus fastidiosus]MCD7086361.1 ribosome maturation factor RimP [Limosilactobacillus fastidiosus]MCD7115344.1 ribosome maturation factor RimP [Limosilactobacillus fastidiosus]
MEVTQLSSVVETVTELAEPILANHSCYLYDLEFVKEGKNWYLRVYVDKDGGVTLEDCADISDELSEALDNTEPDPIPQAYFLEVSSPGAERPLKKEADYERAVNDYIHVSLYRQVEGKKVYEGTLVDLKPDELTLEYMDKTRQRQVKIDRKVIAQARLAIDFSKI